MSKAIPPKRTLIEYVVDAIVLVAVGVPFLAWCGGAVFAMTQSLPGFAVGALMIVSAYLVIRHWLRLDKPDKSHSWAVDEEASVEAQRYLDVDDVNETTGYSLLGNPDLSSGDLEMGSAYLSCSDTSFRSKR